MVYAVRAEYQRGHDQHADRDRATETHAHPRNGAIGAEIGFVPVGSAVITRAGKLSCNAVIHTVGPRIGEGDEDNKLLRAVQSSLTLAAEKGFKSISIPAISSGIFGFPKDKCAKILVEESERFLEQYNNNKTCSIDIIEFCIFDNETLDCFKTEFASVKNIK